MTFSSTIHYCYAPLCGFTAGRVGKTEEKETNEQPVTIEARVPFFRVLRPHFPKINKVPRLARRLSVLPRKDEPGGIITIHLLI